MIPGVKAWPSHGKVTPLVNLMSSLVVKTDLSTCLLELALVPKAVTPTLTAAAHHRRPPHPVPYAHTQTTYYCDYYYDVRYLRSHDYCYPPAECSINDSRVFI